MANNDAWSSGLRGLTPRSDATTPRPRATIARPGPSPRGSENADAVAGTPAPGDWTCGKRMRIPPIAIPPTTGPALKPPLPKQMLPRVLTTKAQSAQSSAPGSPESVQSELPDEVFMDGDSVQVFVRVRPCNVTEVEAIGLPQQAALPCVQVVGESSIVASTAGKDPKSFTFDKVLPESASQLELFEVAGIPMVDNCISGYNSAIFVYGQTGAGKTFTMMGELGTCSNGQVLSEQRGLAPRMIELLFERISEAEDAAGRDSLRYSCRCSCLEIYNETISDLLSPSGSNLQLREDPLRGIYVDGLCEKEVLNVDDVMSLMRRGNSNRHVGETAMNAKSSRSHCVFTCLIERSSKSSGSGATGVVASRLNLIDLAGSERIKGGALGGSQAQGEHFKEAVHINQSLTTLGRVIMELVEAQRGGGRQVQIQGRHIPYRDSRLTFLLQDSLGGNAKTMIIANVSPSQLCAAETVSTLQFASRAKCIRNRATISLNYRGDIAVLQREVARLNVELDHLRKGFTDPAVLENKELRARLDKLEKQNAEDMLRINSLLIESARHKKDRVRMEGRLESLQAGRLDLSGLMEHLQLQLEHAETSEVQARAASQRAMSSLSVDLLHWRQQADLLAGQLKLANDEAKDVAEARRLECEHLVAQHEAAAALVQALKAEASTARIESEQMQVAMSALRDELAAARGQAAEAQGSSATLAGLYASVKEELEARTSSLTAAERELEAAVHARDDVLCQASNLTRELLELRDSSSAEAAGLLQQLEEVRADAAHREEMLVAKLTSQAEELQGLGRDVAGLELARAAVADRAAEQERRLRVELEHLELEVHELRLAADEKGQAVATEVERADSLARSLSAEAAARAEVERQMVALQLAEAEGGQRLVAVEHDAAMLRQQLAVAAESRAELERLLSQTREEMGELKETLKTAAAESQQQRALVEQLQQAVAKSDRGRAEDTASQNQEAARLHQMVSTLQQEISGLTAAAAAQFAAHKLQQADAEENKRLLSVAEQQLVTSTADLTTAHSQLTQAFEQQRLLETQVAERQEQTRGLQRELIKAQETMVSREYELRSQSAQLSAEVERLRRDCSLMQNQLDKQDAELSEARALVTKRERELSDIQRAEAEDKSDLEHQVKGYLVTNTRQNRAFQEIMRLIEWATTPPSSGRSSAMGLPEGGGSTPTCPQQSEQPSPATCSRPGPGSSGKAAGSDLPRKLSPSLASPSGRIMPSPMVLNREQRPPATATRISLKFSGGEEDSFLVQEASFGAARLGQQDPMDDDVNSPLAAGGIKRDQAVIS